MEFWIEVSKFFKQHIQSSNYYVYFTGKMPKKMLISWSVPIYCWCKWIDILQVYDHPATFYIVCIPFMFYGFLRGKIYYTVTYFGEHNSYVHAWKYQI